MNPIKKNKAIMISKRAFQVLVTAMIIVLAFPNKSGFKYEFALGGQWKHEKLVSPIDFPILKTEKELSEDKNQIINSKQLYYKKDNKVEDSLLAKINEGKEFSNEEKQKIINYLNKIYTIGVIKNLVDKCDYIIIGGGMTYTFVKALGGNIGKALIELIDEENDYRIIYYALTTFV